MRLARTIARIAAVYLLLGFVTTWAVAWGLALREVGRDFTHVQLPKASVFPIVNPPLVLGDGVRGFGSVRLRYHTFDRFPNTWTWPGFDAMGLRPTPEPTTTSSLCFDLSGQDSWGMRRVALRDGATSKWASGMDDAYGFPVVALWCSWTSTDPRISETDSSLSVAQPTWSQLAGGLRLPNLAAGGASFLSSDVSVRALPYYPIWSGLALNTAFYALVFFVVTRTLQAFKHARRYRRGLCPRCKYDRTFEYREPCPECGHAARSTATTSAKLA